MRFKRINQKMLLVSTLITLTSLILHELLGLSSTSLAEEGKWTKKADMLTARFRLSTSVVNGKIYVIGGSGGIVEEYDLGFAGTSVGVKAKEKLVTSWGKIKSKY